MIVLYGVPISNYFNKVKLVLLEKGIPFTEERVFTGSRDEAVLAASPLGKIPYLRTPQGTLCESQVMVDWIEAAYPQPALVPADAFGAAKVRELTAFVELHLELAARDLYPQAFFGGTVSEGVKVRVRKTLDHSIPAFKHLAKFGPYLAGDTFTLADCAAWVSLPLVAMATKAVFGEDLLTTHGVDWRPYVKFIGERPCALKVAADRKADATARA